VSASDLSFLSQPLPVGEDPALDTADAEFQAICDLANAGDFAAAATRIEPLVARGVYDLRLVTILFVSAFQASGWGELARVLRAALALVGDNREAFGPFPRRDTQLDKRLAWTFERIADLHAYHASKSDTTFKRWDELTTAAALEEASEAGRTLSAALGERGYQEAGQRFGAVSRILAERSEVARRGVTKVAAPVVETRAEAPQAQAAPNVGRQRPTTTLVVTDAFLTLEERLSAFAVLAARGDHERAAVVAEAVLAEIDAFDPRKYFPDLFAPFYGNMSRDIAKVAPYLERQPSPRAEMLRQLLRIDLARFMEGE
jgi:hypothetical protein